MPKHSQKEYVRNQLLEQGLSGDLIDEALKNTGSNDLEILLEYIEERQIKKESEIEHNDERERKKKLAIIEEQKRKKMQDMIHKKKLLEQIAADRIEMINERKREIRSICEEAGAEKTVKIEPGENECDINILNLETGDSFNVVLKKTESILLLLQKIEELTGYKEPEIFDGDELIEDDRRSLEEHGFHPFVNLIVKQPE